jgi:hypothetical protein
MTTPFVWRSAALALLVVASFAWCAGPAHAPTPIDPVAVKLAAAERIAAADGLTARVSQTDTVTAQVVRLIPVVRQLTRETRVALDSVPTLPDSLSLPYRFAHMVAVVDSLTDAVDSLLVAHEAEREAWRVTLAAADRQRNVEREARLLAEAAAVCKIGPMPCPSRRTAFGLGFAAAVAVIVLR